jgi:hypothetical protein
MDVIARHLFAGEHLSLQARPKYPQGQYIASQPKVTFPKKLGALAPDASFIAIEQAGDIGPMHDPKQRGQ